MSVDIVDSTGANLWPGDAVSSGAGAGSITAVLSSGDDSTAGAADQVVVTIGAGQVVMSPATSTVTSRAGELGTNADQSQDGVVT